jgi:hypothetical protein
MEQEVNHSKEMGDEYTAISKMLKRAIARGIEVEVVAWYTFERMNGAPPSEAAANALWEWDC